MSGFVAASVILFCLLEVVQCQSLASFRIWSQTPDDANLFPEAPWSTQCGGIVAVLQVAPYRANGTLTGYNASTGRLHWRIPLACTAPLFVEAIGPASTVVVVGCQEELLLVSARTGAVSSRTMLPVALELVLPEQPIATGGYSPAFVVVGLQYLIVGVQNNTNGASGTLLYNLDTSHFASTTPATCGGGLPLLSVFASGTDAGYVQVCAPYASYELSSFFEVSFFPFPGTQASQSWTFQSPPAAQVVSCAFAGGASLSNVAVVYFDGAFKGNFTIATFQMGPMMQTTKTVLMFYHYNVYPVQTLSALGEVIVVGLPQGGGLFAIDHGSVRWHLTSIFAPLVVLPHYGGGGANALVLTDTELFVVGIATGVVASSQSLLQPIDVPVFSQLVNIRRSTAPYNGSAVVVGPPEAMIAISGGSVVQLLSAQTLEGLMAFNVGPTAAVVAPSVVVSNLFALSPLETGLLVATTDGVALLSLTVGWTVEAISNVSPHGAVILVNAASGDASAIDRNGGALWTNKYPVGPTASSIAALGYNLVFDVVDENAIAVFNSFSGELMSTLLVPSSCYSNASNPVPVINGIAINAASDAAYFSAQLPCLFSVAPDLTLSTINLPWSVVHVPVLDEFNGLAYVYATHVLYSVSIPSGTTNSVVATFDHIIVDVIPSSRAFGRPSSGPYPIVYVITPVGISAVDALRQPGRDNDNKVWELSQFNIRSYLFFNGSIYSLSQSGICRIAVQATAPQRSVWCQGAYQVEQAAVASNVVLSADGTLLFALDASLYAIDALDGSPRWSPNGFVPLPQGNCTQLSLADDVYVLLALCSDVLYVVDALDDQHGVLFAIPGAPGGTVDYTAPTILMFSAEGESLSAMQMPLWVSLRATFPTPVPTVQPQPESLAPGWTAAPSTPSPYLPPYPLSRSLAPPAPTTFDPVSNDGSGFSASVHGSSTTNPSIVFTTPTQNDDGQCVVAAYNASSSTSTPLWQTRYTPTADASCSCTTGAIAVAAASAANSVVAILCDGVVSVYDRTNGLPMWNSSKNTTVPEHQSCTGSTVVFTEVHALAAAVDGNPSASVVVGIRFATICIFSAAGTVIRVLPNAVDAQKSVTSQLYLDDVHGLYALVLVGLQGLQVLRIPRGNATDTESVLHISYHTAPVDCGSNLIVAVTPNQSDGYITSSSVYAACVVAGVSTQAVVFSVDIAGASVSTLANFSLSTAQLNEFLLVGSTLLLSTSAEIFKIAMSGGTSPLRIAVAPQAASGFFMCTAGSAIVAMHFDADISLVEAYDLATGAFLWQSNTSLYLAGSPRPSNPIPAVMIAGDTMLLAAGGACAFNITAGVELWATHRSNDGFARQILLNVDTGIVDRNGASIPGALVTYFSTSGSVTFMVGMPAQPNSDQRCYYADYFALYPYDSGGTPPAASIGVVATTTVHQLVPLVTNFQWLNSVDASGSISILSTAGGAPTKRVLVAILLHTVALFDVTTGAELAVLFRSEYCSAASGKPLSSPVSTRVVNGTTLLFSDDVCLYSVNASMLSMAAVFLSMSLTFPSTSMVVSLDNRSAFLSSAAGILAAVDLQRMHLMWMSDSAAVLGLGSLLMVPLWYEFNVPTAARQVVAVTNSAVLSFSVATGALLWLFNLPSPAGSVTAATTNDGTLTVLTDCFALKIDLEVSSTPGFNRLLSNRSIPGVAASAKQPWTLALPIPNSPYIIALSGTTVVAIDGRSQNENESFPWVVTLDANNGVSEHGIFSYAVPYGFSEGSRAPTGILVSGAGTVALSLATGDLIYSYERNIATSTNVVNSVYALSGGYASEQCLAGHLFPAAPLFPPTCWDISAPMVPDGYAFSLPLPASAPAPFPQQGSPVPLFAWQRMKDPMDAIDSVSGFATTLGNRSVLLLLSFNGSTMQDPTATINAIDVYTGDLVASMPAWTRQCNARSLVQLSSSFAGVLCVSSNGIGSSSFSLALVATHGTTLTIGSVVQLPYYFDSSIASIPTGDAGVGCIYTSLNSGGSVLCFSLGGSRMHVGRVQLNFTCPRLELSFVNAPFFYPPDNLLVVSCLGNGGSSLTALHVSNGTVAWTHAFGSQFVENVYFSTENDFGAALMKDIGSMGNLTFLAFSIDVGPGAGTLATTSALSPFTSVAGFTVRRAQSGAFTFTVVDSFSTPNAVAAYSSVEGQKLWQLALQGSNPLTQELNNAFPTIACALMVASANDNPSIAFEVVDFFTGVPLFESFSAALASAGIPLTIVPVFYTTGVVVALDNAVVFAHMYTRISLTVPYRIVPEAVVALTSTTASLLDFASIDGTVTQIIASAASTRPLRVSHFAGMTDVASSEAFIVASSGMATYLLNGSGSPVWGTQVKDNGGAHAFDPALFSIPSTGRKVLLKSAFDSTFYGFDAANGTLLYSRSLPLCRGQAFQRGNALGVPDHVNNALYLEVENPCLYKVDAATGDVSVIDATSSSLVPVIALSQHCVLLIDAFGTVTCVDRQTDQAAWYLRTGYVGNRNSLLQVCSTFVFVTIADRLMAILETTGHIVWELNVGPQPAFTCYDEHIYVVSRTTAMSIALDPSLTLQQRQQWRVNVTQLLCEPITANAPQAIVPVPIVSVNGNFIFALGSHVVALDVSTGNVVFNVTAQSQCSELTVAPPQSAGSTLNNLFVSVCGITEVRSVVSGQAIVVLGQSPTQGGCSQDHVKLLQTDTVAFCNANNDLDVQALSSFVVEHAPEAPVSPTQPPQPFTLPPNFQPQGAPTPAPTIAGSGLFPDVGCVMNIEALYPALALCLNTSLVTAYAMGNPNHILCNATAAAVGACVEAWQRNSFCTGSLMYLNTVVTSLVNSGALSFCQDEGRCADGQYGALSVCTVVKAVAAASGGVVLPATYLASIPAPANVLPSFQVPPSQESLSPHSGLSAVAVSAIVLACVGAAVGAAIAYHVRRKRSGRKAVSFLIQEDGGDVSTRELGSLVPVAREGTDRSQAHYATL